MTRCKLCRKEIPDGTEYCKECQDKQISKTNETYLDSLLNSVIDTPNTNHNSMKSIHSESKDTLSSNKSQNNKSSEVLYDKEDIDDFDSFNIDEDLNYDLLNEQDGDTDDDLKDTLPGDIRKDIKDDIQIDDDELFGDNLSDLLYDEDISEEVYQEKVHNTNITDSDPEIEEPKDNPELMNNETNESYENNVTNEDNVTNKSNESTSEFKSAGDELGYEDQDQSYEPIQNNILPDEVENLKEDDGIYPSLDDLLQELEASSENPDGSSDNEDKNPLSDMQDPMVEKDLTEEERFVQETEAYQENEPHQESELHQENDSHSEDESIFTEDMDKKEEPKEVADDDFFSLLNQIDTDDPVADDVKAIGDLLNESAQAISEDTPNDVGEVFSDALKVVTSLHDPNEEELGLDQLTDKKGKRNKEKQDKKKKKKSKKSIKTEKNTLDSTDSQEEKTKKKGIFTKLFKKSKDDKIENKDNSENTDNTDVVATEGETSATKDADNKKASKKKVKIKEKKAKKDKKEKKKKGSKKAKGASKAKGTSKAKGALDNNEAKKASKSDNSGNGNADKENSIDNVAKEIKKQNKVPIQVIDEIEDEGKINRAGAFTVFLFFGLILLLILAGTNIFSYTISIKNAKSYFDTRKYTEAYNEVYGIDIKAKDLETYDKIMTVMFVNKQLNSYNNYYTIKKYPEALDALLKGLKRYDKYVTLANMLGIKSDLDYVRKQILSELSRVFNLSEKDAMRIIKSKTQSKYSMSVYNAVIENMKKDRNFTVKE